MRIKKLIAAVMAVCTCCAMAVSMTGCGNSSTNDPEKKIEDALNSMEEKEKKDNEKKASEKKDDGNVDPLEICFDVTDEIKNADFNSGLVQCFDDVFQLGGFMTVQQFIDQYGEKYDCSAIVPETLLESIKGGENGYLRMPETNYVALKVPRKDGKGNLYIGFRRVYLNNPEIKRLADAVIMTFSALEPGYVPPGLNDAVHYPLFRNVNMWFPGGMNVLPTDQTMESIADLFAGKNLKKVTDKFYSDRPEPKENTTYGLAKNHIVGQFTGTNTNLLGDAPIFTYTFYYDSVGKGTLMTMSTMNLIYTEKGYHYFEMDMDKLKK